MNEAFILGLGTVRECLDCGALIAGGPTRCIRCAKEGPPQSRRYSRIAEVFRIAAKRWYIRIHSLLIYPWWRKCDGVCGWTWPFGYVPECGCPIHDPDD